MTRETPVLAAKRLARQLNLPSWCGAVLVSRRGDGPVLVVAAQQQWRRQANIPAEFAGLPVEQEDQLIGVAYG